MGNQYCDVAACEHRGDRDYDDQDASHVLLPNGTLVASFDRAFVGAACREAIAMHLKAAKVS